VNGVMAKIPHRILLLRTVIPMGKSSGGCEPSPETLPAFHGDEIRFRIPVAMIEDALARKQRQSERTAPPSRKDKVKVRFSLPLIRTVIPPPPPCPLPPPLAGNVVRFRIPIEMIRQALLRKQRQTATVSYTPNVARTSVRFTIPLHRIEMPLGPPVTKR
jgi:hypothetical protein